MKTIKFIGLVIILPLILVRFDVHSQSTMPDKLYLVRKIYIGEIEDIDKEKRIKSFLKQELEARGLLLLMIPRTQTQSYPGGSKANYRWMGMI